MYKYFINEHVYWVEVMYVLCAQCKSRARYGRWKTESPDDLLPQFLSDDRHDSASLYDQLVQGVQVQYAFSHDR